MKVSYKDITRRICNVGVKPKTNRVHMQEAQIYTDKNVFCKNNAMDSIRHWYSLAEDTNIAFEKALDIFSEICMNCNESEIRSACDILVEVVSKVRDQAQLQRSLKYRMGVMKKKISTKNNKIFADIYDKLHSTIGNLNSSLDSMKSSNGSTGGVASSNDQVSDTVNECFNIIYDKCIAMKECDRIVENYNKLSRIFNLDRIVTEIHRDSDSYDACIEIAKCVDTCATDFKVRYNTALETAAYVFDKHLMGYPKNKIVEAVTDYFIFSGALKEEQIEDVTSVIKKSVYFDEDDFESVNKCICDNGEGQDYIDNNGLHWTWSNELKSYILAAQPKDKLAYELEAATLAESYGVEMIAEQNNVPSNKEVKKAINKATKSLIRSAKEGNSDDHKDDDIKDMVADFRKNCIKDKSKDSNVVIRSFKDLINKIYSKSPTQIVNELPDLFSIIRLMITSVGFAVSPVLGILTLIANCLMKIHISRKQLTKTVNAYNNEINSIKDKIKKNTDKATKDRLNRYLDQLKKDLDKIEMYERDQYSDDENEERDEKKWDSIDSDDNDFDFDFDDDDDWDDIEEVASAVVIANYMTSITEMVTDANVDGIIYDNIFKLSNDNIDDLTDFSITVPVILEKDKLREALEYHRNELRTKATDTKDYIRIDCLNENIYKLKTAGRSYNTSTSAKDAMLYLACLNEIAKIGSDNVVMEMEFSNTIKLAVNRLKKSVTKLSDKEKQASKSIDIAASNVAKGIEDALMTNNREAVLRGHVIPSLSKCIKLALGLGVAWAVNPAVATITAVGGFACSRKLQAKERQLVLDDIDIELKMCERYMQQAEDKKDMKAIRQIEIIQRNLQRQKQRIKYKMVTVYSQRMPPKVDNKD